MRPLGYVRFEHVSAVTYSVHESLPGTQSVPPLRPSMLPLVRQVLYSWRPALTCVFYQSSINSHRLRPLPHSSTPSLNQLRMSKMHFQKLRCSRNMLPRVGWQLPKAQCNPLFVSVYVVTCLLDFAIRRQLHTSLDRPETWDAHYGLL